MAARLVLLACFLATVPAIACSLLAILGGVKPGEGAAKLQAIYRGWLSSEAGKALTHDELSNLASDPIRLSGTEAGRAEARQLLQEFGVVLSGFTKSEREIAIRGLRAIAGEELALRATGQAVRDVHREQTRVAQTDSLAPFAEVSVPRQTGSLVARAGGRDFFFGGDGYGSFDLAPSEWRVPNAPNDHLFFPTPDAKSVLVTTRYPEARPWIWKTAPGELVPRARFPVGISGTMPTPVAVHFSADASRLGYENGTTTAALLDMSGAEATELRLLGSARHIGFSPSGKQWWSIREKRLRRGHFLTRYDIESGNIVENSSIIDGSEKYVLRESPDGVTAILVTNDGNRVVVHELDTQTLQVRRKFAGPAASGVYLSPDSEHILFVRSNHRPGFEAELWSSRDGKPLAKGWWPNYLADFSFSPDGKTILVGEKIEDTTSVQGYDLESWIRAGRIDRRRTP